MNSKNFAKRNVQLYFLGLNGEIVFSLQTEQEYFAISSSSGVLFVARELDVETYDSYELPIAATDRGTPPITSMSTVHITVVCSSSGQCPSTRSGLCISSTMDLLVLLLLLLQELWTPASLSVRRLVPPAEPFSLLLLSLLLWWWCVKENVPFTTQSEEKAKIFVLCNRSIFLL